VAQVIASELKIGLTQQEETRFADARQVNPDSYDAYLKGSAYHERGTPEGLKIALQYYNLALEIDSNNALAYLGVSGVWAFRYQAGWVPRQEAMPLITTPLEKALELDKTLADAHAALAFHKCWREWDWEGAEKEFREALRLNPNLADAHAGYSLLLCIMGRADEGLAHMELALELNPLDPGLYHSYAWAMVYHRRWDDAISAQRTALEIEPNYTFGLSFLADLLGHKGMQDEQLAIYRKIHADDAELTEAIEDGFKEAGYKGAFRAVADLMAERYERPGESASPEYIGIWYQLAGDYDLTIDWLEKSYEEHEPTLPLISSPLADPLRSNPRFLDLLRKMNLPVDEKE
jgi:Tfp pilus assembly protein PilF